MSEERQAYFAYGSNMDRHQMADRCRDPLFEGPARLSDHRFMITRRGYANVIPAPGQTVHGVLWSLLEEDLRALDRYEGVRSGAYRRESLPVEARDRSTPAWIYLGAELSPGLPVAGYLEAIVKAAQELGLPPSYVDGLKRAGRR